MEPNSCYSVTDERLIRTKAKWQPGHSSVIFTNFRQQWRRLSQSSARSSQSTTATARPVLGKLTPEDRRQPGLQKILKLSRQQWQLIEPRIYLIRLLSLAIIMALGISSSTFMRIVKEDLKLHCYKLERHFEMHPRDKEWRLNFT